MLWVINTAHQCTRPSSLVREVEVKSGLLTMCNIIVLDLIAKPKQARKLHRRLVVLTAQTLCVLSAEPQVCDALPSQQEALLAGLRARRAALLELLQTQKNYEVVLKLREEVLAEATWFSSGTEDAAWAFVQEGLLLFLVLTQHLSAELQLFHRAPPPPPSAAKSFTAEAALPLSPDVLSVSQEKTLAGAVQLVVSLGLCPYLAPGVGVPLARRSSFGTVVEKLLGQRGDSAASRRLFTTTRVLLQFAELSSAATLVFTRHLCDLMAALCQLGYQPRKRSSEEDQVTCANHFVPPFSFSVSCSFIYHILKPKVFSE